MLIEHAEIIASAIIRTKFAFEAALISIASLGVIKSLTAVNVHRNEATPQMNFCESVPSAAMLS